MLIRVVSLSLLHQHSGIISGVVTRTRVEISARKVFGPKYTLSLTERHRGMQICFGHSCSSSMKLLNMGILFAFQGLSTPGIEWDHFKESSVGGQFRHQIAIDTMSHTL